ncbi:hypothetical protein Goshw_014819, partial [Gossypium schwendimanii]|nr:hypothetical protein [Gossypium schwendimanii]
SHWSTLRLWRCTSRTEYYDNLDSDNRFPCQLRIHSKPYLLSPEERQWQLRVQRERRDPLNPRRRDGGAGPSMRPRNSPGPLSAPITLSGPATALT